MGDHGIDNGLTNYGDKDFARFLRRSFARSMGLSRQMLAKPIVGIAMTPSGFNNCHRYMPDLVEAVSRGVLAAGALPRLFPTVSLALQLRFGSTSESMADHDSEDHGWLEDRWRRRWSFGRRRYGT